MTQSFRIAIVAGEASGDILGAGLIKALRQRYPDARFEGIGGPLMIAEGFHSHFPMERLSVMGLVEVLGRLKELLGIRKALFQRYSEDPPDLFLGIDAPDFNLPLERRLKAEGVVTAHYVSPSIWAWRQKRVEKIKTSVDLMLTLLPFEAQFYHDHNIPVCFVGHPLADQIALENSTTEARQTLGLPEDRPVVALLPGSRGGEVGRLGELFLQTAQKMQSERSDLCFVLPAANKQRREQLQGYLNHFPELDIKLIDGQSHLAMQAADAILIASGTATLEAALLKKPMVVSYRMAWLSYKILSRMVKIPWVSLPNLLAQRELVPELLQDDATVDKLAGAILERLDPDVQQQLHGEFLAIHKQLKQGASNRAAEALSNLLGDEQKVAMGAME